jgi:serine/threonine protein kinase
MTDAFVTQMDLMKNKKTREDCRKEINLLKQLHHENIIRYYSSFIGILGI